MAKKEPDICVGVVEDSSDRWWWREKKEPREVFTSCPSASLVCFTSINKKKFDVLGYAAHFLFW